MPPITKLTDKITVCEKFPLFTDSQGKVKEVEICYQTTAGEYIKDHPLKQLEQLQTKKGPSFPKAASEVKSADAKTPRPSFHPDQCAEGRKR